MNSTRSSTGNLPSFAAGLAPAGMASNLTTILLRRINDYSNAFLYFAPCIECIEVREVIVLWSWISSGIFFEWQNAAISHVLRRT